jgi:hypothetical protein
MDEKQLKSINSKSNHKKFVDNVNSGNVEKVNKVPGPQKLRFFIGADANAHAAAAK